MKELLKSVKKSLENENWYAALTVALIMPDICGKMDNPNMKSGERYKIWFDKYIKPRYQLDPTSRFAFMFGGDCYAIRCAMLHEFSEDLTAHKAREIIARYRFRSPDNFPYGMSFRLNGDNSEIELNVDTFCNEICIGVSMWLKELETEFDDNNFVKII